MIMNPFFKRVSALILMLILVLNIFPLNLFAAGMNFGNLTNRFGLSATEPDNKTAAAGFSDISGHWAAPAIGKLSALGVLQGYDRLFRPDDALTRAELTAVLARVIGFSGTGSNPFTDVDSTKWYYDAVSKLAAAGILVGFGGLARPEAKITREEAVVMIVRAFEIPKTDGYVKPFKDKNKISPWAADSVKRLQVTGCISGRPDGTFDPRAAMTRAEFIAVVENILRIFNHLRLRFWDILDRLRPARTVTVTFETNGGSELSPLEISRGGILSAVPMPVKENYAFTGWYTDASLGTGFYSEQAIEEDITLYAGYAERSGDMNIFTDPNKYIEDCDPVFILSVLSSVPLTAENLSSYTELTSPVAKMPALELTDAGSGEYKLSPVTPYTAGALYEITLKSGELSFTGESESVRKLSFRIHKEEAAEIEHTAGILYVLLEDVTDLGEGAYTVAANKYPLFETGDVICFWNGVYDAAMKYRNVVHAELIDGIVWWINTEASSPGDVFAMLDIYTIQGIPIDLNKIDTEAIAQLAKNSAGTQQMTAMLNEALMQSPTIQVLAADEGYFLTPSETAENRDIPIGYLFSGVDGLTVRCYVAGTDNANFPYAFNEETAAESEWGKDYSPVLTLEFEYSTVIGDRLQIDATVTIKEYLSASLQGGGDLNIFDDDFAFDYAVNLYSQTDIFFEVLAKSVDETSEFAYDIDVTEEIEKLLAGEEEGDGDDPAGILKKVLGDKGDDYLTLVEANIIDIPIQIIPNVPVGELHIKLDFIVKVNFAAGISSKMTLFSARQIGIAASSSNGYVRTYNNELFGNNRYAIDIYVAGYAGIKAGLKGTITFSVLGLEALGKVGTSLEVGAYGDAYGFVHAEIVKTYPNDYVHAGRKESSLSGAIYFELGIYLELQVFAESEVFGARASFTIADLKFPLLSLGERYVLSKFVNDEQKILMNTESMPFDGGSGLLTAEYIDIKTGEKVTGNYGDPSAFYVRYSSPYFSTVNNAVHVNKSLFSANIKRLEATAYIFYGGGALTFTGPRKIFYDVNGTAVSIDTPRTVKLIWIDSSIDASQVNDLDTVTATYILDIDGERTVLDERTVLFAEIPGSVDLSALSQSHKIMGYANDYNKAIEGDTEYVIYVTPWQRLVSFITFYEGAWHFEVFAVNSGETPPVPAKYNTSAPEVTFREWHVNSGYWAYTGGNYYSGSVIPMKEALKYGNQDAYTVIGTTAPLYSFTGTIDQCYNAYYNETYLGKTYNGICLALYEAQYQKKSCTVTIEYPAMSYSAMGTNINYGRSTWSRTFLYGDPILITGIDEFAYYGCEMLGWDTDNNGTPDYDKNNPPAAVGNVTFRAVMRVKTFAVAILDHAGAPAGTETCNIGSLPAVLGTSPAHPDAAYKLLGWEVSKNGGAYTAFDRKTDPGVYEPWTVRPVYGRFYTVTFSYYVQNVYTESQYDLQAGVYDADDYVDPVPSKLSDERNDYIYTGWDCGETFTVSGDMTVTALFDTVPIEYTVTFTTPHDELSTGGQTHSFLSTYDGYAAEAADYIALNSALGPVLTEDKVWTFDKWSDAAVNTVNHTVGYLALWTYEYRSYTVTFDGGEGHYRTGEHDLVITHTYGTTAHLLGTTDFLKDEDVYGTYILTGWLDPGGVTHLPDAMYTVTGDITYTAVYGLLSAKTYTVTFGANGGTFPEGGSTLQRTYGYGDVISDIPEPSRAEDAVYTYVFERWDPDFVPVTADAVYTAVYTRTVKEGIELPTGVMISDGTVTEDINLGTIPGYTYTPEPDAYGGFVPTLTITAGGLTVSGEVYQDDFPMMKYVRVNIASSAPDVCFEDLTLSKSNDRLIYAEAGGTPLTVTVRGTCSFGNYGIYTTGGYRYSYAAIESARSLTLTGAGTDPLLELNTEAGASAVICGGSAVIHDLAVTVNMEILLYFPGDVTDNWGRFPAAFNNGQYAGSGSNWEFTDCEINADADGRLFGNSGTQKLGDIRLTRCVFTAQVAYEFIREARSLTVTDSLFSITGKSRLNSWGDVAEIGNSDIVVSGTVTIAGESHVTLSADIAALAILRADRLDFTDFTGSFSAFFQDVAITLPAVRTVSGIGFFESGLPVDPASPGSGYDLHGAQPQQYTDGETYYTFTGAAGTPLSAVSVEYTG